MARHAVKRRKLSHDSSHISGDDGRVGAPSNGVKRNGLPANEAGDADSSGALEDLSLDDEDEDGNHDEEDDSQDETGEEDGEDEEDSAEEEETPTVKDTLDQGTTNGKFTASSLKKVPSARKENGSVASSKYATGLMGTAYTAETYKSNVFKLQVDDLLEQVRPRQGKRQAAVEKLSRTLKAIIEQISEVPAASVAEATKALKQKSGVVVPFPYPKPALDSNYKLAYAKPSHINAAGSFPLNTHTRTGDDMSLDLVVTMPNSLFQEKDYMNHRYFYKRAFYLACIAAGIKANREHDLKCSFDNLHGNQLLPILIVEPGKDQNTKDSKYCIVVLPSISEAQFPASKLVPTKNCVRPTPAVGSEEPIKVHPTPFYNASVHGDALVTPYLKLQHDAAQSCEAYRDTCILGRIWLRQRGFASRISSGGFGNFEWAVTIALLLKGGGPKGMPAFSPGYSSYQLFKAALQYLSAKDLVKSPQIIGAGNVDLGKSDGPILFDATRGINVFYKMTSWSWKLLQHEARTTLSALGDSNSDHFDATFITKVNHSMYKYDQLIEIPVEALLEKGSQAGIEEKLLSKCRDLYRALSRGLADRVKLVGVHLPEERVWSIDTASKPIDLKSKVTFGIMIDPANAYRTVDHGPSAESKSEAASFRKFWGEKAELRRFKDGSILESLVWSEKNETRSIFRQVVEYILQRHFGQELLQAAHFTGDQYAQVLGSDFGSAQAGIAPFQPTIAAFQTLERDLRDLEDLPLQIRHLFAADAELAYASVQVSFMPGKSIMQKPANVVLQFEGSARWPDDLSAIQRTKIAFLLKVAELLSAAVDGVSARVGLENQDSVLLNQSFLDVVYPTGAAFRLRIHHEREAVLLERRQKDKSLTQPEKSATATALSVYKRVFIREPSQAQALQTLCTRFPALSASIRMVKKWFASHRLSPHFAPELIELFVLRAFTDPYPWLAPASPTTGLLRTLLFLSKWDWRSEPLVVDLGAGTAAATSAGSGAGSAMSAAEAAGIRTRYEAWRKIDPALNRVVLFAASSIDTDGTTWTDHAKPPKVVAGRMTALAQAAVAAVREKGSSVDIRSLFVSGLGDYNVVVHLDAKVGKRHRRLGKASSKEGLYKNLALQSHAAAVQEGLVGYDPAALLLRDLQATYGDAMIFFFDENEEDVIAGLWDPSAEGRPWKTKLAFSSVPVKRGKGEEEKTLTQVNKAAIVNEIAGIGGDLVKKVEWR